MQEQLNNMANSTQPNTTKPCLNKCKHSQPPYPTSNPKSTTKANLADEAVEEEDTEVDMIDVEAAVNAETTDYSPSTAGLVEIAPTIEPNVRQNLTATSTMPLTPRCKTRARKIITGCDGAGQQHLKHP
jgi:hypothetical protein